MAQRSPHNRNQSREHPKTRHNGSRQQGSQTPGPCPEGITKHSMQAISSPYNFVPLPNWVHLPEWGKAASHDWPFQDGISGEIHYTLHTDSPLLVGGKQTKATDSAPGKISPFKLPDGRYAIPGSSIKGMLRAVVEIIGFGRMRMVDEQRPGLRDISGKFVKRSYIGRVRNKVKTGFLQQTNGKIRLVPCSMIRLEHRSLEKALGVKEPIFKVMNVREKYQRWENICKTKQLEANQISFDPDTPDATNLFDGATKGIPVFTGQISDSTKEKGKRRDFIFYDPREADACEVTDEEWRDFLRIHGDEGDEGGMPWPGYWRGQFRHGHRVPVFYVMHGARKHIGLAYMPKLAGDFSTLDMIEHAAPEHRTVPGMQNGYDLADLLFGTVGDTQGDALRGRVSCETARLVKEGEPLQQQDDTILNSPKPTYFPNYLTQKTNSGGDKLAVDGQYATYVETQESSRSTLRGFKRYPARPSEQTHVQPLTQEQAVNKRVQVRLLTLQPELEFKGRIVFHNLKPEELGALLWALTWGDDESLRHSLGMGKSFGFGQTHIEIDTEASRLMPNDPAQAALTLSSATRQHYRQCFEDHMENHALAHGGWRVSPQIANLLAMANPSAANKLPSGMELRHMMLMRCESNAKGTTLNEFVWAKQDNPGPFVLADYAKATGWDQRVREQAQEARKQAEAREQQAAEKRADEARDKATRGLPDDAAAIKRLELAGRWTDNGTFVASLLDFLNASSETSLSKVAYELMAEEIEKRLPGLLANPDAKKGKKQEPKFKPKQIELAKRLISMEPPK